MALAAAEDFTRLGLGSMQLWRKHRGNVVAFLSEALNAWLLDQKADELRGISNLHLSIRQDLKESQDLEDRKEPGSLFALIECEQCGYLELGDALEALEQQAPGLGEAFYDVLLRTLHGWVNTYNVTDAEMFVDNWKESIEMDLEEGENFAEHCERNEIMLPDLDAGIPSFVRTSSLKRAAARRLLKAHRAGPFGEWITLLLAAGRKRSRCHLDRSALEDVWFQDVWEEPPFPAWLLVMRPHDAIEQSFDEVAQTMHEYSHEPSRLIRYQPGKPGSLRAMLTEIARFVAVNRAVARLDALLSAWRETHGGKRDHRQVA